jgi:Ran-binding protein 1
LRLCLFRSEFSYSFTVDPALELKEHAGSSRAWIWNAPADFADETPKSEVFAIRFSDADAAKRFKEEFDKAREHMKTLTEK